MLLPPQPVYDLLGINLARLARGRVRGHRKYRRDGFSVGEKPGLQATNGDEEVQESLVGRQPRLRLEVWSEETQHRPGARLVITVEKDEAGGIVQIAKSLKQSWDFADQGTAVLHVMHVEPDGTQVLREYLVPEVTVRGALHRNTDRQGMPPSVPCSQSSPRRKCLRNVSTWATSEARRSLVKPSCLSQRITSWGSR